jgi:hypothetical protein
MWSTLFGASMVIGLAGVVGDPLGGVGADPVTPMPRATTTAPPARRQDGPARRQFHHLHKQARHSHGGLTKVARDRAQPHFPTCNHETPDYPGRSRSRSCTHELAGGWEAHCNSRCQPRPMVRSTQHQRSRLPRQRRPWPSILSSSCWDSFSLEDDGTLPLLVTAVTAFVALR